jgi:hypothetical protein
LVVWLHIVALFVGAFLLSGLKQQSEWNTKLKLEGTNGEIYVDGPQKERRLETGSLR